MSRGRPSDRSGAGAPGPIRVAFVCVENAGRSQMAAALAERERIDRGLEDAIEIHSGGTRPADAVHDVVVEAMAELGQANESDFDLSDARPRGISPSDLRTVDVVVTMGCSADGVCPAAWDGDDRDWDLPDPKDRPVNEVRAIRDEIATRVESLFDELAAEVAGGD